MGLGAERRGVSAQRAPRRRDLICRAAREAQGSQPDQILNLSILGRESVEAQRLPGSGCRAGATVVQHTIVIGLPSSGCCRRRRSPSGLLPGCRAASLVWLQIGYKATARANSEALRAIALCDFGHITIHDETV